VTCNILSFEIKGLYGVRDFLIELNGNKVILVGENGSGKTTVSRIIYATLSCNWDMLRAYPFEKVVINFSDESVEITSGILNDIFATPDIERMEYLVDRRWRRKSLNDFISTVLEVKKQYEISFKNDETIYSKQIKALIPYEYISNVINSSNINTIYQITLKIQSKFQSKILYLPTYRRIEDQLKTIFPDVDSDVWEKARKRINSEKVVELVEFGMDDVERLVTQEQDSLKSFSQTQQNKLTLGYLSEIVSKSYDKSSSYTKIRELSDNEILEVLRRIDSTILSDEMKKKVVGILNSVRTEHKHSYSAQVKIVCHYFMQLMAFNQDITAAEQHIRNFQEKCNNYLISILFFIDRDLSDYTEEDTPTDFNIYVTEKYAIENELCTEQTYIKALRYYCGLNDIDDNDEETLLTFFRQCWDDFSKIAEPIMAQILYWKTNFIKSNYANFKMQNIFEIVGNQLQPRYEDVDSLLHELFRQSQVPYGQVDIAFYIDLRFLYKGIIINHNKKPSQPTLKRRFFKKKAAFFHGPVWERSGADFILKRKGEFF